MLYIRSNEDRTRFMKLRDYISTMRQPSHGRVLLEKAESQLQDAYVHLYKMHCTDDVANTAFYRTEAHGVLTKVLQSLALLNQAYFTKGWGENIEQILQFPLKPSLLEHLLYVIMNAQLPADILALLHIPIE